MMTNDEIKIAIAECCGWTSIREHHVYRHLVGTHPIYGPNKDVPNYPEDLNAMHEAEKTLNENQQAYFMGFLMRIVPDDLANVHRRSYMQAKFKYVHAAAAQRAEAFLRTKGLWK